MAETHWYRDAAKGGEIVGADEGSAVLEYVKAEGARFEEVSDVEGTPLGAEKAPKGKAPKGKAEEAE